MKADFSEEQTKAAATTKKDLPLMNRANLRDIVIVISIASVLISPPSESFILAGLIILVAGSVLHLLVKGVLIRNSMVCRDGIYQIVRHPYYLANYIVDSAFCVITGNLYLVFLYPFLFFWAYGPVMRAEEKYLGSIFAKEYAAFIDAIPQVFPHPHHWPTWRQVVMGFEWNRITPNELSRLGRFWGIGFFLAVLQELRTDGLTVLHWSGIRRDWDFIVFMVFALALSAVSVLFHRKKVLGAKA